MSALPLIAVFLVGCPGISSSGLVRHAALEARIRHFVSRPRIQSPRGAATCRTAWITRSPTPVSTAAIEKYTEDTRVDSRRIREELGFVPHSDLRGGWIDAIAAMRQSGQL